MFGVGPDDLPAFEDGGDGKDCSCDAANCGFDKYAPGQGEAWDGSTEGKRWVVAPRRNGIERVNDQGRGGQEELVSYRRWKERDLVKGQFADTSAQAA